MSDLIDFLRARLDEDEQVAYAAGMQLVDESDAKWVAHGQRLGEHIARHDPARVLREVEAKRRILDEHQHGQNPYKPEEVACYTCHADRHETYYAVNNWCPTIRLLALPYSDHPDYRSEWAVTP